MRRKDADTEASSSCTTSWESCWRRWAMPHRCRRERRRTSKTSKSDGPLRSGDDWIMVGVRGIEQESSRREFQPAHVTSRRQRKNVTFGPVGLRKYDDGQLWAAGVQRGADASRRNYGSVATNASAMNASRIGLPSRYAGSPRPRSQAAVTPVSSVSTCRRSICVRSKPRRTPGPCATHGM